MALGQVIAREGTIVIRQMEDSPADYALLARWLSDERVLEFYEGRDHPYSYEQVVQEFGPEGKADEEELTACILVFEEQPAGYLQFYLADSEEYSFEGEGRVYALDLFIGEADLWGKGLGTRFIQLLLTHLFEELGADWVILDPHVDNPRAIRAYEKCGFRKIKLLPGHEFHEGRYVDCWLMGVQKDK